MRFGGVNGHNTIEPSVNAWSPRIGFAWAPRNKWSFRGSYGVFQSPRGTELYAHDNFPATLGLGFTPHGFIGDGTNIAFPLQTGPPPGSVVFPTVATLTPDQFNFDRVGYYAPKLPLTYFQQFLLSVQRELPGRQLLDVSYIHTKGTHLNFATDMNQVPQSQLANPPTAVILVPFAQSHGSGVSWRTISQDGPITTHCSCELRSKRHMASSCLSFAGILSLSRRQHPISSSTIKDPRAQPT